MTKNNHYLDNITFTKDLYAYATSVRIALEAFQEEHGEETDSVFIRPKMSDSLATRIQLIAKNRARYHAFYSYEIKEDMISEATYNAIKYCHNFTDPDKSGLSYITSSVDNIFIQMIRARELQNAIKAKSIVQTMMDISDVLESPLEDSELYLESNRFVSDYEYRLQKRKEDKQAKNQKEPGYTVIDF